MHTPVVERIDPHIGVNVAGHLGKDSPPKGEDTLERILKQITFEGDTYGMFYYSNAASFPNHAAWE